MHSINNTNDKMTNNNPLIPDVPFHPGPVYRPPPKPIKQITTHAQSAQSSSIQLVTENSWKNRNRNKKTNHMHTKDLMHSINNTNDKMTNNNPLIQDVPFHPGPVYRPPPKPIKQITTHAQIIILILILILKKIPHFKKALCVKCFKDWTSHFFRNQKN